MKRAIRTLVTVAAAGLLWPGCGSVYQAADLGASPGGVQDIGYARLIIESGGVPRVGDFEIDGLLNEHDMPLEGEPCDRILCLDTGFGVGPVVTGDLDYGFLQIGFDSGIDPSEFTRDDLNLAVVIDTSGSMSDELDDIVTALHHLLDQLTPRDRLAIVTYDSRARMLLEPTLVSDAQMNEIERAIDRIEAGGSTNMEEGMAMGYEALTAYAGAPGVSDRLMLFTDVQPNVGATDSEAFLPMVEAYASMDIGLTLFGIGFEFGPELAAELSQVRGANYFFLDSEERIAEVFDQDFDYMVTPLAYDLYLHIALNDQLSVAGAYNVQSADGNGYVEVEIATLFLSRNHGASVLQLSLGDTLERPAEGSLVGSAFFSYQEPDAAGEVTSDIEIRAGYQAGGYDGGGFSDAGTRKAAALINEGLAMKEACRIYWEDVPQDAGVPYLQAAADMLASEAAALEDPDLLPEVDLLNQLIENIENGS